MAWHDVCVFFRRAAAVQASSAGGPAGSQKVVDEDDADLVVDVVVVVTTSVDVRRLHGGVTTAGGGQGTTAAGGGPGGSRCAGGGPAGGVAAAGFGPGGSRCGGPAGGDGDGVGFSRFEGPWSSRTLCFSLVVNKRAFFAFHVFFKARFSRVSRFYTRASVFSEFRVSRAFISNFCGKRRVSANALQTAYLYAAFRVSRFKNN